MLRYDDPEKQRIVEAVHQALYGESYYRRRQAAKHKRIRIFELDIFECVYCGGFDKLTLDHLIPRSRGGTNDPRNLVTACQRCNAARRDDLPKVDTLCYGRFRSVVGGWRSVPRLNKEQAAYRQTKKFLEKFTPHKGNISDLL